MVGECHDLHLAIGKDTIKDEIWKACHSYATDATWMNQFPSIRHALNQTNNALKLYDECRSKPRTLIFIKPNCVKVFSFRTDSETVAYRSNARAFCATSSPGIDGIFPASISAPRRADSSPQSRSNSSSETSSRLNNKR